MAKKIIKAVLFDLDGTLLDTAPDFVAVVNKLLTEEGKEPLAAEKIRDCISNGARALVMMAFNIDDQHPEFARLRLRLLELYSQHIAVYTQPFPGIVELLKSLAEKNISWGIATNKPAQYTEPLMSALNIQPSPTSVICPDHVSHTKPHPESMFLAAKLHGCDANEIIYVGDHLRDIECGRQAGCITIAAAYGYIDQNANIDDWKADYRVNHANEIWPIVTQFIS